MNSDVASHWGKLSPSYNERLNLYCQERFAHIIKPYAEGMILDVGCGTGCIQDKLGGKSIGIDITHGLLKKNKNHIICGDAQKLPFKSNIFDVVYSANLLEHVPNPSLTVSECKRVLKKNGTLILITPNKGMEIALYFAEKLNLKIPEGPHRFLSAGDMDKLVSDNKLRKISSGKIVLFPKKIGTASQLFERLEKFFQPLCLLQYSISKK